MDNEQVPLLEEPTSRWRRRSSLVCVLVTLTGLAGLVGAICLGYYLYHVREVSQLRVMSLNTWGMPHTLGSEDKELRMAAIGRYINQSEHDVYLLEELWMRPDYATIASHVPQGWFISDYSAMTNGGCDGVAAPDGCSGLAVVSRFPFIEQSFTVYNVHGNCNPFVHLFDGECVARKGVGRVRIESSPGHTVDVFLTHTCASDYNSWYRQNQSKQLVDIVKKSEADFVILGGDFNSDPVVNKEETTLSDIEEVMVSAIEEFFKKVTSWLVKDKATYGNPLNSYSSVYKPVHYDYIFHKANHGHKIWTNFFDIPIFKTPKSEDEEISFSDHEAVTAHLYLWKQEK